MIERIREAFLVAGGHIGSERRRNTSCEFECHTPSCFQRSQDSVSTSLDDPEGVRQVMG